MARASACLPTAASSRRTARPASSPSRRRALARDGLGRLAVRAQHRPHPRPVAHHDAHRPVAAALRPTSPSRSWRSIPTTPRASAWSRARWRASRRCTARPSCASSSIAGSSRAPCSCRSTGRPRTARAGRIGALVQAATDPVLRPARGEGDACAHRAAGRVALRLRCCRESRSGSRASAIGPRARTTFGHMLNFALDAPREGWQAWLARGAARGRAGELRRCRPPASTAWRCSRTAASRPIVFVGPDPKLPSPEWLKSQFDRRRHSGRRAARAARRRGRSKASPTRARSCACASRWARDASRRPPRPATARRREIGCAARRRHQLRQLHSRDPPPAGRNGRPPVSPREPVTRPAAARRPPAPAWSRWRSLPLFFRLAGAPRRRHRRQRGSGVEGRAALRGRRHGRGVGRSTLRRHGGARRGAAGRPGRAEARLVDGPRPSLARRSSLLLPRMRTRPPASMAPRAAAGVPVNVIDNARLLHLPVRRHRQPLAAGRRHLDGRRRAGVRPGHPLAHRGAAAGGLRALGRRRAGMAGGDCRPGPRGGRAAALLGGVRRPSRCARRTARRRQATADGCCETAREPERECAGCRPRHAGRCRARRSRAAHAQGRARAPLGRRDPVRRSGGARGARLRAPRGQAHPGRQDRAIAPPASRTTSMR